MKRIKRETHEITIKKEINKAEKLFVFGRKIHKPLARLTKEIVRKTQVKKIIDDTGNNITDIPEK